MLKMPYVLWKHRNSGEPGKYWVINKITREKFSSMPLPKDIAIKQMKALYANDGEEYEPPKHQLRKTIPGRARVAKGSPEAHEKMAAMRAVLAEKKKAK